MKQPLYTQSGYVRGHAWTEDDIAYIKENAGKLTAAEMAQHIGVTPYALKNRAHKHGISLALTQRPCNEAIGQAHAMRDEGVPIKTIAHTLGLTTGQLSYIFYYASHPVDIPTKPKRSFWTEENVARLCELATKMRAEDIAALMKVKVSAIRAKANGLGLSLKVQAYDQWDINMTHALRKPPSPLKHAEIAEKLELSLTDIKKILRSYKPEDSHASF